MAQMLQYYAGPGSNKKVITLSPAGTLKYLALQAIDIAHDCAPQVVTKAAMDSILHLQAVWLLTNNHNLGQTLSPADVAGMVSRTMMDQYITDSGIGKAKLSAHMAKVLIEDPDGKLARFQNSGYTISGITDDPKLQAIVDNCADKHYLYCQRRFKVLTLASIYDGGSWMSACKRAIETIDNPRPVPRFSQAFLSNYYQVDRTTQIVTAHAVGANGSIPCDVDSLAIAVRDKVIIGYIPAQGGHLPVVIAFQGASTAYRALGGGGRTGGESMYAFSGRATPDILCSRGVAPLSAAVTGLFRQWLSLYTTGVQLTRDDLCIIYNELCAKHWGDMGMVCEAVDTDMYVITHDKFMVAFCGVFGVNFASSKYKYTKPPGPPKSVIENNTGSSFYQTYQMGVVKL
jgi:hypothetical protein